MAISNPGQKPIHDSIREIASGLRFPEGPIVMPDGSFLVVEVRGQTLARVCDGRVETVAELGGGPNGAAIGPDGACYVCNNGGLDYAYHPDHGYWSVGWTKGGRSSIDRVDLGTGKWERLYTPGATMPFNSPNDLVFDRSGGFWFTDTGGVRDNALLYGGVYYAKADGSRCEQVIFPLTTPNGIGLSPDERYLYVAETLTSRVWRFELIGPGEIKRAYPVGERPTPDKGHVLAGGGHGTLLAGLGGFQPLDSLAIEADGHVCVAAQVEGGIVLISPDGTRIDRVLTGDSKTTNICFGGPDLRTAYITLGGSGRLVAIDWPRPGLALNYLNT